MQLAEHSQLLQEISRRLAPKSGSEELSKRSSLHPVPEDEDTPNHDAVGFVLDTVSRVSHEGLTSSIDRLRSSCSGSPDYYLESKSSFFPEQCTIEGFYSIRIYVNAMMQLKNRGTYRFFLTYVQTPRRWQRVVVTAQYQATGKASAFWQSMPAKNDTDHTANAVPEDFQRLLNNILSGTDLVYSANSLSIDLQDGGSSQLTLQPPVVTPEEHSDEATISEESQKMQDTKDMGCRLISEADIVEMSSLKHSWYRAWFESRMCLEEKVPFATSRSTGRNAYDDFFKDLRLLKSLQGCPGIPGFIGVICDESKTQLKGYLYECPTVFSLQKVFVIAKMQSRPVSWPVREYWARKIVEMIAHVHKTGFHLGFVCLARIRLKADGTPLSAQLRSSPARLAPDYGRMPPELRDRC